MLFQINDLDSLPLLPDPKPRDRAEVLVGDDRIGRRLKAVGGRWQDAVTGERVPDHWCRHEQPENVGPYLVRSATWGDTKHSTLGPAKARARRLNLCITDGEGRRVSIK